MLYFTFLKGVPLSLLKARSTYAPMEYPEYHDIFKKANQSHWVSDEVNMSPDINDWKIVLSESEKNVIGHVLKGFVATETYVEDFWAAKVGRWFKIPEIQRMAHTFSAFESIHSEAYAVLNESLNLTDYDAFLHEPSAKAKIDRLTQVKGKSVRDIARSLAIFSAFTEGVNLFSSFAILLNFSRFNKMKGMGQIISWSIRDESLHSQAGCMLFNQLIKEHPDIWDDTLKQELYEAARLTIELEDSFITKAFSLGQIEGLELADMKTFIRHRCNQKLQEIGLKSNWKNLDKSIIDKMKWFDVLSGGNTQTDFFSSRETNYSKGNIDWSKMWE